MSCLDVNPKNYTNLKCNNSTTLYPNSTSSTHSSSTNLIPIDSINYTQTTTSTVETTTTQTNSTNFICTLYTSFEDYFYSTHTRLNLSYVSESNIIPHTFIDIFDTISTYSQKIQKYTNFWNANIQTYSVTSSSNILIYNETGLAIDKFDFQLLVKKAYSIQ